MSSVPDRNGELLQVGDTVRLWRRASGAVQPMKRLAKVTHFYNDLVRIATSTGRLQDYIRTMVEKVEGEEKPEKEDRRKDMAKEKKRKRVWWTSAEKEKLVHLVIARQETHSERSLLQCVQHVASTSMPEGRRRHIRYMSVIKEWFNPLYNKYRRAKPYVEGWEIRPPPKKAKAPPEQIEKKEEMSSTDLLIAAFGCWLQKLDKRLAAIEEAAKSNGKEK